MKTILAVIIAAFFFGAGTLIANAQTDASAAGQAAQFDYYVLSLSWAPSYCESHPKDHSSECTAGEHTGFVLHGLWPQKSGGQELEACTAASPVAKAIVDQMLQYMPSRGLIQHEWATHGTCSGLSSGDYFHKVIAAFRAVQIPDQFAHLTQAQKFKLNDIEASFATANHASGGAFRISCHEQELVNLEVCLDKNLHYQACGDNMRDCPASSVLLPAPK